MLMPEELDRKSRPREPESNMVPGMSAPMAPRAIVAPLGVTLPAGGPNVPQTGGPGYVALKAPLRWFYDYDPVSGAARAQFPGIVSFNSGGAGSSVASFNGRSGAVTLLGSDVQALAPLPLTGVSDGSNAAPGMIGEVFNTVISQSGFLQAGAGYYNLVEIGPVPAGDWDVYGNCGVNGGATIFTGFTARYSDGSNPVQSPNISVSLPGAATLASICCAMPVMRLSLAAPFPTLYLQAAVTGNGNVSTAYAAIFCRRVR